MSRKNPAHGQHGLGARGQGKQLYFHTQAAQLAAQQAAGQAKGEVPRHGRLPEFRPQESRRAEGRRSG